MLAYFIHCVFLPLLPMLGMLFNACCCGTSCTFVGPLTFASGAVTDNFSVVSGSWSIGSGLLSTSSTYAVLTGLVTNPLGNANLKISCSLKIGTAGDVAMVLVDYADSSNYWYVEIKAGSGAYLKIFQVSGGSLTEKATAPLTLSAGSTATFCASVSTGGSVLSAGINAFGVTAPGSFTNATWGLGTGALSGTVSFDNLSVSKTSAICPECSITGCSHCTDGSAPLSYKLVISGVVNGDLCTNCSTYNGTFYLPCTTTSPNCRYETLDGENLGCSDGLRLAKIFISLTSTGSDGFFQITTSSESEAPAGFVTTNPFDCINFDEDLSIFVISTSECDWSSASVHATAI